MLCSRERERYYAEPGGTPGQLCSRERERYYVEHGGTPGPLCSRERERYSVEHGGTPGPLCSRERERHSVEHGGNTWAAFVSGRDDVYFCRRFTKCCAGHTKLGFLLSNVHEMLRRPRKTGAREVIIFTNFDNSASCAPVQSK